ncbi:MAG: hypothetical protein ACU85U_03265, partial [Gammaproteobacteria bacterium]
PGMVSFAGGLPAAETFPQFGDIAPPRDMLQYGPSEGEPALREQLAGELRGRGLACAVDLPGFVLEIFRPGPAARLSREFA